MSESEYLFENQASEAGVRFDALASLFDPVTIRHLETIGVSHGWHCLDVGAGGGSIARWMASRVGEAGHVLATDLDVRWLQQHIQLPNVEVLRHDIARDPMPVASFDLVHERLVLIHVPERVAALDRMVSGLRPGGWLLVEDFDSIVGSDEFVEPMTADEELTNRVIRGVRTLLAGRGADTGLGRKLPAMLRAAGLEGVGADAYQVIAGADSVRQLQLANIRQVADSLVERSLFGRDELDRCVAALERGEISPFSPLLVSAWGRRPQGGP